MSTPGSFWQKKRRLEERKLSYQTGRWSKQLPLSLFAQFKDFFSYLRKKSYNSVGPLPSTFPLRGGKFQTNNIDSDIFFFQFLCRGMLRGVKFNGGQFLAFTNRGDRWKGGGEDSRKNNHVNAKFLATFGIQEKILVKIIALMQTFSFVNFLKLGVKTMAQLHIFLSF